MHLRIHLYSIILFFISLTCVGFASDNKFKDASLITKKRGVYLGYERGLYDVAGFGMEFQRKKMAIKEINTQAFLFGVNYNFKYNIFYCNYIDFIIKYIIRRCK